MILRYCPPFIFAHRCYLERAENEMKKHLIEEAFGRGGKLPDTDNRWRQDRTNHLDLKKMGLEGRTSGIYYGFRTRDDQVLFYMLFEGRLR